MSGRPSNNTVNSRPCLTWDEVFAIAQNQGFIRWHKKGMIEQLSVVDKKVVTMRLFLRRGRVSIGVHFLENRHTAYYCEEVKNWETLPLCEILDIDRA